jgi:hypothetical protein
VQPYPSHCVVATAKEYTSERMKASAMAVNSPPWLPDRNSGEDRLHHILDKCRIVRAVENAGHHDTELQYVPATHPVSIVA